MRTGDRSRARIAELSMAVLLLHQFNPEKRGGLFGSPISATEAASLEAACSILYVA
jgi:hypothetical protein